MSLQRMLPFEPLSKPQTTLKRWVTKPSCFPFRRQTWVLTTFGSGIGYLHTPTTKANYATPYMQRWPAAKRFTQVFGAVSPIIHEWMMGWPEGWSDIESLAMDKYQRWQQQLYGVLRLLTDSDGGEHE